MVRDLSRRNLEVALADRLHDLREREPGCLLLFAEGESKRVGGSGIVRTEFDLPLLLRLRGGKEGLSLFYMGDEPWKNYSRALESAESGIPSYCMADLNAERLPPELQLFSPNEAMSRSYWETHPLRRGERSVALIGCGAAGGALLERALLTNVFEKGRCVHYPVFDGKAEFPALHPEIIKALGGSARGDRLSFHEENWQDARALLEQATPLKADCGRYCGAACCASLPGEETGMLLFAGEAELYEKKPGWTVRETGAGLLAVCPGMCDRNERPLACRIFPLLPVIREGTVKAAADQRARAVCPLLRQGIRGTDPAFRDAVREAGRLLAEDPEQREFLEMLTAEQDELKALREKLGGT